MPRCDEFELEQKIPLHLREDGDYLTKTVKVGDLVRWYWGGTASSGTRRTTTGTIVKLWSDGTFTASRTRNRQNAHGHADDIVEAWSLS